ncbi:MAG: tryptophan-rich sensory protein [Clostridia bacterium]|nr:tryptophan-rich sensory protein [Clostridia bacterium]
MNKLLNLFAFIAMVAINILANVLPIGGLTTAEVSAKYQTLITPAGFTFGIWGLIYFLLGIFVFLQLIFLDNNDTYSLGYMFALSCGLNIAWILAWQFEMIIVSFILIAALWVVLKIIDNRNSVGRSIDGEVRDAGGQSNSYFCNLSFKIYYAWITAATLIALVVTLTHLIPQLRLEANAVIIAIVGLVGLSAYAVKRLLVQKDIVFTLVTAWAILGVFINHVGKGYKNMFPAVTICSIALTVILTVASIVVFVRKYFLRKETLQATNVVR